VNERFKKEKDSILNTFLYLDIAHLAPHIRDLPRDKVGQYGNKELEQATKYFNQLFSSRSTTILDPNPPLLCPIATLSEWKIWKNDIITNLKTSSDNVLKKRVLNSTVYPKLCQLYSFIMVIPLTTVECERSFSIMNLIKTDIRFSLAHETLDNLMAISILDPIILSSLIH